MTHDVFSPDWVEAWRKELIASDRYRLGPLHWHWPILLLLRSRSSGEVVRGVFLEPTRAECRPVRSDRDDAGERAEFVLSADAGTWQDVMVGRVDPLIGLLGGKLTLEKGRLVDFGSHSRAARALLATGAYLAGTGQPSATGGAAWATPRVA